MLQAERDEAYRFYVTDSLKAIGGLNLRFADLIKQTRSRMTEEEAVKEAEEIKTGIIERLRRLGG